MTAILIASGFLCAVIIVRFRVRNYVFHRYRNALREMAAYEISFQAPRTELEDRYRFLFDQLVTRVRLSRTQDEVRFLRDYAEVVHDEMLIERAMHGAQRRSAEETV